VTQLAVPLDRGAGAPVVLLHAEGVDASIWAEVAAALPGRVAAPDLRGHGRSDVVDPPYAMGALVGDVERMMEARGLTGAVIVGLSLGGMIAQALAVKRLDLVRGIILINSAAKIGTRVGWEDHAQAVARGGMAAVADDLAAKWAPRGGDPAPIAKRLLDCAPNGYRGVCAAMAGTDLLAATATLRLPALALAGREAQAVPPDLVCETAALIPGSEFALIPRAGHLAPLDAARDTAAYITTFLERTGHA